MCQCKVRDCCVVLTFSNPFKFCNKKNKKTITKRVKQLTMGGAILVGSITLHNSVTEFLDATITIKTNE